MKKLITHCMSGKTVVGFVMTLGVVACLLLVTSKSLAQRDSTGPQPDTEVQDTENLSFTDHIEQMAVFAEHVRWVGNTPPQPRVSEELHGILSGIVADPKSEWQPLLEAFIQRNSQSPWIPSLRANLAQYYRRTGSFSKAMSHWDLAWRDLERYERVGDMALKLVRSQVVAQWSRLLSSLGRVDALRALYAEVGQDPLGGARYFVLFERSLEAMDFMVTNPERSFRCGSLALVNVADALGIEGEGLLAIQTMDSPVEGFSIRELKLLQKI